MVKRRGGGGVRIYKRRGSLACVASGIFFFSCGSKSKRFSRAKAEPRTKKKTMKGGGGGGGEGGKAGPGFESWQVWFFLRLSFRIQL